MCTFSQLVEEAAKQEALRHSQAQAQEVPTADSGGVGVSGAVDTGSSGVSSTVAGGASTQVAPAVTASRSTPAVFSSAAGGGAKQSTAATASSRDGKYEVEPSLKPTQSAKYGHE